jgi:hypothetical protein
MQEIGKMSSLVDKAKAAVKLARAFIKSSVEAKQEREERERERERER